MRVLLLLTLPILLGGAAPSAMAMQVTAEDTRPTASPEQRAESYHQFILGRHLEGQDDSDAALEAYERAADLDPGSAELLAEIAGLHARQNRATDALEAGEAALRLDPDNAEAHRVLATIFSALADSREEASSPSGASEDHLARAIRHLEGARVDGPYNRRLEFTLGRFYVRAGAHEKAIEVLDRFVERTPGPSEGVLLLAGAQAAAGRPDEAIQTLKATVAEAPDFFRGLSTLARLYEKLEQWDEAADTYAAAVEQNPSGVELGRRHASALLNGGRTVEAREVLRAAAARNPDDASTLYMLAQVERRSNDLDAAEATARRLVELDPDDLRGSYALVQVFEQRRQPRRIVDTIAPLLESDAALGTRAPLGAALLAQLGFAYLGLEQPDRAIETFERARETSPSDPAVAAYLTRAHIAAGHYSEAALLARRARTLHPSELRLTRLEAEALHMDGKTESAIGLLEESVRLHADVPEAHLALAALYADSDRPDDAIRRLEDADARFPDTVAITFQRGAVLEQQRRYAEAEQAFAAVLDLDSQHAPTLNYLGYMLAERGEQLERAVDYIRRALAVDPENGAYADSLGWAYFKQDKLDLAEIHLLRAAHQLASNSVVQDHVGELFFKLGRFGEAIAAWGRSLNGDGESIERREIEEKIERARHLAERDRGR